MKNKILIVDKNEQIQNTLTELVRHDYDCILLQNSKDGICYLEENTSQQIDLIITDLEEETELLQLISFARNHYLYKNIPILIEASPEQTELIANLFAAGADDILAKPLNLALVKKRITNMLHIGGSRRIHNVMEDLIQTEIDKNIDVLGICPCPKCRKDLLTLTLNNVPPRYVSTEKGTAFITAGRLASMDDRIQLLTEITRYAKLIGENPHHEG